jgi:phage tail-like protein
MTLREDRFHLLLTPRDWGPLNPDLHWDEAQACLTLRPFLARAHQPERSVEGRRGVARSSSGALWWIAGDGRQILVQKPGAGRADLFWPAPAADEPCGAPSEGAFGPAGDGEDEPAEVCGLAVTNEEYLVAGLPGKRALLCCDLLSGAQPVLLRWPGPLAIIDMAAARGGGLVILEGSEQPHLWWLDRHLRIQGEPVPVPARRPVALELLPDGSPLVLTAEPSMLYRLRNGQWEQADLAGPPGAPLLPYDFAFEPDPQPERPGAVGGALYVATRQDEQVFAFRLTAEPGPPAATLQLAFLPVYHSRGWGLLAAGGRIWYDSGGTWAPLTEEQEPRYAEAGELVTAPGQLDGREMDCVWHRIFLDASIPPGTAIRIATRTAGDAVRPDQQPWQEEPQPYLRPDGRELAYMPPYTVGGGGAGYTGTWELLLQQARGRYLQLRITLTGTGRASPRIHALRVAYPRFSYLTNYLPTAFQNDASSASFLERFLANPEGVLTKLEQRVANLHLLFNPRTAPPEYLRWLAEWLGLVLDERWEERRCRLLIAGAMDLFRSRGTLPGLVQAIRLATDPVPTEAIFTADISPYTGFRSGPHRTAFRVTEAFDGSHRFTIYLTADPRVPPLDPDLVRQVVELERPAHTQYEIKPEWAAFRVSSARVGLETVLAGSGRLAGLVLGQGALGETCLAARPPWDLPGQAVVGREQVGPGNARISSKGGPQHGNIRTGWADLEGAGPV